MREEDNLNFFRLSLYLLKGGGGGFFCAPPPWLLTAKIYVESSINNSGMRVTWLLKYLAYWLSYQHRLILLSLYVMNSALHIRGLQCFKLNVNQTENVRYWQKNNFLLFAKCLKMYSFFAFAFKVCKKCYYDPKKIFLEKYKSGYQKTQNFMLISNSLMPT